MFLLIGILRLLIAHLSKNLKMTFCQLFRLILHERQIWLFYAEKWIFFKKLGTLLNQKT